MRNKLNLGAFIYPLHEYHNVDIRDWHEMIDEIVDLNFLPWPWPDAQFEEVRACDIVEHLGELTKVQIIEEIARIVKPNGFVEIRVPNMYHRSALACLQHAHVFNLTSFDPSYSQPWFHLGKIETSLGLPYAFPFRMLTRWLIRLGFIDTITFYLIRRSSVAVLYESGDERNER